MVSKAVEEYIKTMYVLEKQKQEIRVTDIAEKINCSKASVTKTIKKLKEQNLLKYETYGKIELTKESVQIAQKALEAYDIVNLFLTEVLNIEKEKVVEQAKNIKKVISDETLNKLASYVHKQLGLNSLDCGYDINKERCRECLRRKNKEKKRHIEE